MIKPTIGRIVLVSLLAGQEQFFPALITAVHGDTLINVGGFNDAGSPFNATSIQLLQDDDKAPESGRFAKWIDEELLLNPTAGELHNRFSAIADSINTEFHETVAGLKADFVDTFKRLHEHFAGTGLVVETPVGGPLTKEQLKNHVAALVAGVQSNMNVDEHITTFIDKIAATVPAPEPLVPVEDPANLS